MELTTSLLRLIKVFEADVDKPALLARFNRDKRLAECAGNIKTKYFLKRINGRCANGIDNNVIHVYGQTGSGKSTVAMFVEEQSGAVFTANEISFSVPECREKVKTSKKNTWHHIDEQREMFGAGSHRIMEDFNNLLREVREAQIHFTLICPEPVVQAIYHYYIEVIGKNIALKKNWSIVYNSRGRPLYSIITGLPSEAIIKAYRKPKTENVERVLKGEYEDLRHEDYVKRAKLLMKKPEYRDKLGLTDLKIIASKYNGGLTGTEIDYIARMAIMIRKGIVK